jgi:hypothetical protein
MPAFGVQFHGTWGDYTDEQRAQVLDELKAAGVRWVRIDLGWRTFQEKGPGTYASWYTKLADGAINAARSRGMNVLATLLDAPGWANGGQAKNVPPADPEDYGRMAYWAADHFKGRVAAWEVWNEPNRADSWAGTAADYVRLLKAAYPRFKAGDPAATVVLGGSSYNDADWLSKLYDAGARRFFDVVATHPYQGQADLPPEAPDDGTMWRLSHVAVIKAVMDARGDGCKEIWFTEFGWSSHPNAGIQPPWMLGVSPDQQGDYLKRTVAFVESSFPYVTHVFWYRERDAQSGNPQEDNYGLLNRDLSPKPVYQAVLQLH